MSSSSRNARRRSAPPPHRPVRLLTLTTLFPNSVQGRHGIFIATRLRRLCDTGRVTSTVIAAIPRFPGAYRHWIGVPDFEEINGFSVFHPRYSNIPGIGMRMQPRALANSLLGELRRRSLDRDAFDVVDAHYCYPDGVAAARVASALKLPLIISARGSDINRIGEIGFARRSMISAAQSSNAMIAVSRALADRMGMLGMSPEKIRVLRNGVDTDFFSPIPRLEARRLLDLDESTPLVLAVGNLVPEKGLDLLIRAMASLPAARLLIVGEGPLLAQLRALADAVAPGRVHFRGSMLQSELRIAYAAADVLGLPSLREGWPNVVLEAMACGTPVAASRVGGVPEILQPGSPGIVLADRSVEVWSKGIGTLIGSGYAQDLVRRYATRFGWDEVITEQCALYESVAGARHAH